MESDKKLMISVVIPVYNAEAFLVSLLPSLKRQNLNSEFYEVLLIDNNSVDLTAQKIKKYVSDNGLSNFHYLFFDNKQCSYATRNYGIGKTKGNILAFTDADCILDEYWLENIFYYFKLEANENKVLSGKIDLIIKEKRNIWEQYDKIVYLKNEEYVNNGTAATANLAVSKKTFEAVGQFQEIVSGGDSEWTKRAFNHGYNIQYLPEIIVHHPSRKTFEEHKKKMYRIGFGRGKKVRKDNLPYLKMLLIYLLKVFYLKTNYTISKNMIKDVGLIRVIVFNISFLYLRIIQFWGVKQGYKSET